MEIESLEPKVVRQAEGTRLNVLGDNQIVKLNGKDTNGLFTLIEQDNQPGTGIPLHMHENEDEIFSVLEGKVEMTIGDKSVLLESGDLIFCPKGIPHSWKVVGDTNAKATLSIYPSGLENMFEELSKLPPGPPDFQLVGEICGKYNISFV